jgi:hypothetical protein
MPAQQLVERLAIPIPRGFEELRLSPIPRLKRFNPVLGGERVRS